MATANFTLSTNTTAILTYTINSTDTAWSVTLNSIRVKSSRSDGTTSKWSWHVRAYRRSSALNVSSQKNTMLVFTETTSVGPSSGPSSVSTSFTTAKGVKDKTVTLSKTSSAYTKTHNALSLPYLTFLVYFDTADDNQYAAAVSVSCTIPAKKSYSVAYNGNGATSGSMTASTKWINETLTLTANAFTRTNYVFYHWNTNTSNTGTSYNNKASYTANAGATLYAIWNPQITYNANGGTGAPSTQTKTFGTNINLSTTKPTRTGYTFLGWATSNTATTATYQPGATYTANTALSLYAVWKVTSPTVRATAYRVVSGDDSFQWGGTEPDERDEGTYACVTIVTTPSSVAALTSISVTLNGHTATHTVDSSNANGGTVYALLNVSCDVNTKYDGTVSVSDNKGNTTTTTFYLAPAFFIMDFRRKGHAVGLGGPAGDVDDVMDVYYNTNFVEPVRSLVAEKGAIQWIEAALGTAAVYVPKKEGDMSNVVASLVMETVGGGAWIISNYADEYLRLSYVTGGDRSSGNNSAVHPIVLHPDGSVEHLGDVGWTNLPLGSAVEAYSSGQTPQYRRVGQVVTLVGACKNKAQLAANGSLTLGTLPAGCRPHHDTVVLCQGSSQNKWCIAANASGTVIASRYSTGGTLVAAVAGTWIPFNITFLI